MGFASKFAATGGGTRHSQAPRCVQRGAGPASENLSRCGRMQSDTRSYRKLQ